MLAAKDKGEILSQTHEGECSDFMHQCTMPPAYRAGGLTKAVIKDVYVLRAFRPLLGQPMRVRDEMNKSSF